ncbi:MAG TPA: N-acetylglucosamine-6-phosphate deacetylase [Clostridiales bacterium]|nr:N-acetylglucosamine-6-phosphate deacetylase [Clostridiales bacterium]
MADKECLYNCILVLPNLTVPGSLLICGDRIAAVEPGKNSVSESADAKLTDLGGCFVSPGFVEIHSHGAGGYDFMDNTPEAFEKIARTHLEHGVTTLFPTAVSADTNTLIRFLETFKHAKSLSGARTPGVHLEGPYLSEAQKGAMDPRYLRNPDKAEYMRILEIADGDIARWTVAPELHGALELGDILREYGIVASIGHTNAEYKEVKEAFRHGYSHFTHFYSCMSTITRRNGFRITGALESGYILEDATVEIIADGCHLPIELIQYVVKAKGVNRVCLTGDSMRCAGTDAKESFLGPRENGIPVIIEDGVAKLTDRSAFAGSVAMADRLLRVAHFDAGIPLHDAVRMMSLTPAAVMGLDKEIGSIEPGKKADLVVFDADLKILAVMLDGKWVKRGI